MKKREIALGLFRSGKIFYDIEQLQWVPRAEYLSGNVGRKIKYLEKYLNDENNANKLNNSKEGKLAEWIKQTLAKNLVALKKVRPIPALPNTSIETQMKCLELMDFDYDSLDDELKNYISQNIIEVGFGSNWFDLNIYNQFLTHLFKIDCQVDFIGGSFYVYAKKLTHEIRHTYAAGNMDGIKIIEALLNLKTIKFYKEVVNKTTRKKQRIIDVERTQTIRLKMDEIKEEFEKWLFEDEDRAIKITLEYNEIFNSYVEREFDGSHLSFPGLNPNAHPTPEQKNDAFRIIESSRVGLFAEVGFGKTWVLTLAAMELKRLRRANKILITVLNSTLEQWIKEIKFLYPTAKVLYSLEKENKNLSAKDHRALLYHQIISEDWDIILLTHEQFLDIPLSPEVQVEILNAELQENLKSIEYLDNLSNLDSKIKRRILTKILKQTNKIKEKIEAINLKERQYSYINWDDLKVDCLMIDESQQFKNLGFFTAQNNIAGISNSNSQRASNLYYKIYCLNKRPKTKVVFATGTPISNTISELYTLKRYLAFDVLERTGLNDFDRWVAQFGEITEKPEVNVVGEYKIKSRFNHFKNLPELMTIIRQFASIRTNKSNTFYEKPIPHYFTEEIKLTAQQKEFMKSLAQRADNVVSAKINPKIDNMAKISAHARMASLDVALVGLKENDPNSKLHTLIRNVYIAYSITKPVQGVQIIFVDYVNYIYDYIIKYLVALGIPSQEIAAVQKCKNREEVYSLARKGKIRIILASTQIAGTGVNIQNRLAVLHHGDVPWRPSDVVQREGRIVRPNNKFKNVIIIRYVNKSGVDRMTFDVFAWQTLENKAQFYEQIWTNQTRLPRKIEDIYSEKSLSYSQVKALASGNPILIEQSNLNNLVKNLEIEKSIFKKKQLSLSFDLKLADAKIEQSKLWLEKLENNTDSLGYFDNQIIESREQLFNLLKSQKLCFENIIIAKLKGIPVTTKLVVAPESNRITIKYIMDDQIIPTNSLEEMNAFLDNIFQKYIVNCYKNIEHYTKIKQSKIQNTFPKEKQLRDARKKLKEIEEKLQQAILEEANTNLIDDNSEEIDNLDDYSEEQFNPDSETEKNNDVQNSYFSSLKNIIDGKVLNFIKTSVFVLLNKIQNNNCSDEEYQKYHWIEILQKEVENLQSLLKPENSSSLIPSSLINDIPTIENNFEILENGQLSLF